MKKLYFFLFIVIQLSYNTVNAQNYDYSHKIDIDASIEVTSMNDIYNQLGVRYLGYGYYLCTAISASNRRGYCDMGSLQTMQGTSLDQVTQNSYNFTERGTRKSVWKTVYLHKSGWDWFPIIKKHEAIEIIRDNKELLELGLITQEKYDKEFKSIQRVLKYR